MSSDGAGARACLAAVLALGASCQTFDAELASSRAHYHAADFAAAQAELDTLIAEEQDLEVDVVSSEEALGDAVDITEGDTLLYLLDRAMTCLGTEELETGTELLRRARDRLDDVFDRGFWDVMTAVLVDEESTTYPGHDYEHVMVRAMLAVFDLVTGRGDAYAYALQLRERQEEILDSDFGEEVDYNPREQYQRVAVGAYLAGLIKEGALEPDEAELAYRDARTYSGPSPILDAAVARAAGGAFAGEGEGVLHVFYLAGRGPYLEERVDVPSDVAARIAGLIAEYLARSGEVQLGALFQGPVEMPSPVILDPEVPPLVVSDPSGPRGTTEVLLDVNRVVGQQIEANLPLFQARAVVRRTLKATAAAVAEKELGSGRGILGALTNLVTTVGERADTRCWSMLPAQIQVARIPLAEGESVLDLGGAGTAHVRITRGRDTYLVVLRPNLGAPGVVLVDAYSRPLPPVEP